MIKNKIRISQLTLMLLLILPGGKYLSLPALLAADVGKDSWLVYALLFAVDFIVLLAILWTIKLNKQQKSFYVILSNTVSIPVAKVIFVFFGLLYSARIMLLCYNSMDMFASTFSIDTNWLAYSIPICAIIAYALYKGCTTIARVSQLTFVPIILSLLIIVGFSAAKADFTNLKPILDKGFCIVTGAAFKHTFWFADSIILLFLMDYIEPKKDKSYPLIVAFAIGSAICIALNTVFISLFDTLAPYNILAMSKVSQFFIQVTANGRLDWLTLSIWLISVFIKMLILGFCAYRSWNFVFGLSEIKYRPLSAITTLLPIVVLPLFVFAEETISNINRSVAGQVVLFVLQYALPLIMPLLAYFANKKEFPTTKQFLGKLSAVRIRKKGYVNVKKEIGAKTTKSIIRGAQAVILLRKNGFGKRIKFAYIPLNSDKKELPNRTKPCKHIFADNLQEGTL